VPSADITVLADVALKNSGLLWGEVFRLRCARRVFVFSSGKIGFEILKMDPVAGRDVSFGFADDLTVLDDLRAAGDSRECNFMAYKDTVTGRKAAAIPLDWISGINGKTGDTDIVCRIKDQDAAIVHGCD